MTQTGADLLTSEKGFDKYISELKTVSTRNPTQPGKEGSFVSLFSKRA